MTLLREFHALGVEVVGLDHQPNPLAEAICGRVELLPCRSDSLQMGRWHLTLLRRIPGLQIPHDVLFDPTGYPNAWGQHPCQAVLVHDLSMYEPGLYQRGKRTWFRWFYGRALRKAQLCICVSEHTRSQLLARFDLAPDRCVIVPNSLDKSFALTPEGDPHPATPTAPYLLTVGTIETRKNLQRVLEAFASAAIPHRLVLAGRPGNGSDDVLTRAKALGERVTVLHDLDDRQLRHLYRRAAGLVFASSEEGFGLPILEAMQSGIPVLTSDVSAMPEVAGGAALLVDPTDTTSIRLGIEKLATDQELSRCLVAKGHDRIREFEPRRNAERVLQHLQTLTSGGKPSPG